MDTNSLLPGMHGLKENMEGSVLPSILKGPTMPSIPTYMYKLLFDAGMGPDGSKVLKWFQTPPKPHPYQYTSCLASLGRILLPGQADQAPTLN